MTLSGRGQNRILYMNTCDPRPGVDHLALRQPGSPATHRPEPDLCRRQRQRCRSGRWRGDLGAGRSVQDRQLSLLQQRVRRRRPRRGRRGGPGLQPVRRPAGLRRQQHLRRGSRATGTSAPTEAASAASACPSRSSTASSPTIYAIGNGANPAQTGTPGGGSGGAIYNDGNTFTLTIIDTVIEDNHANEGGGAVFFVSNDLIGHAPHRGLDTSQKPERRLRDVRVPRHLLLGERADPGRRVDDRIEGRRLAPGAEARKSPRPDRCRPTGSNIPGPC